jgi:hypothetical protein
LIVPDHVRPLAQGSREWPIQAPLLATSRHKFQQVGMKVDGMVLFGPA